MFEYITIVAVIFVSAIFGFISWKKERLVPLSVNYHFLRQCNYACGFCFHTDTKTGHVEDISRAKEGLKRLKENGMKKINFAGGEPFLRANFLGELVKYCKEELKIQSVSIVSNGSKIKENWFQKYAKYLDILAISCDSFDEETNKKIGRGSGSHLQTLKQARQWCQEYKVKFKLNTVVCSYNWQEDMNQHIQELAPFRWKVFQVLRLEGENSGNNPTKRDITPFLIDQEQFARFLDRHRQQECLVPEDNFNMKNSYLILDEYMRFLNCTADSKEPSQSILDVGVQQALKQSGFDRQMFINRGGIYEWTNQLNACVSTIQVPDW